MRIVVVEQRGSGGMIHYAYQLCTALAEEGADVTLMTTVDYELEDFPHNFRVEKFMKLWNLIDPLLYKSPRNRIERLTRSIFWTLRRATRAIRLVNEWVRLTHHIARQKPDVVLFGQMKFSFEAFFMWYLKQRGIFLSQICHEFELRDVNKNLFSRLESQLYIGIFSLLSAIFVHGDFNRQRFLTLFNILPERVHAIRHGNELMFTRLYEAEEADKDLSTVAPASKATTPTVLFFGNITPSKGVEDLIEAFALVQVRCPDAKLVIAGSPAINVNMNSLYERTQELKLSDHVKFDTRYIPMQEIGFLMKSASVVVYPYRSISQSGALQVAYAFGRPVVATRVGGFPEAVDNGKNGYLVEPKSAGELSEAIMRILENQSLAEQMGQHSRALAETRFAWRPIAKDIIDKLTEARQLPAP